MRPQSPHEPTDPDWLRPWLGRLTLAILGLAPFALLLACLLPGLAGEVFLCLIAATYPLAAVALGARRRGGPGRIAWHLAALAALHVAGFLALLALRGRVLEAPWVGGLPLGAAIELWVLFALPLAVVPLLYAFTFRDFLREDELAELRRRFGRSGNSREAT